MGDFSFSSRSFPYFPSFYNKYILLLQPANKEIHGVIPEPFHCETGSTLVSETNKSCSALRPL